MTRQVLSVSPRKTARGEVEAQRSGWSLPPESSLLQLLDHDLVFRGPPALGTENRAVGIPGGVRALPPAEPADRVVHGRQKKSSKVSSFFAFWTSTFLGFSSPSKPSWNRSAWTVPMRSAFSSQPYTSVTYARVCATRRA